MKKVVAVSGGVDSVVLLHWLVQNSDDQLVVAHFDHGMRPDSAADARFVEALADFYGLPFELASDNLSGQNEQAARQARYRFLFDVRGKYEADLLTAHHLDDLVETIAINFCRGTRWRGLACMSDQGICRPLINWTKSQIIEYANQHHLEWCEDSTNRQEIYQRNRLRKKVAKLPLSSRQKIFKLWQKQSQKRQLIETEIEKQNFPILNRYFLIMISEAVAIELLYEYVWRNFAVSLLTKQLEKMLLAIKSGKNNKRFQIGQGIVIKLTIESVIIEKDYFIERTM